DVGSIEEEAALLGPHAVDRNLGGATAHGIVAADIHRVDAWLKQRELLERAAVEREVAHLLFVHEAASGPRNQVEERRLAGHGHHRLTPAYLQPQIDYRLLAHGEVDAGPQQRLEAGGRGLDPVFARGQGRLAPASARVGQET